MKQASASKQSKKNITTKIKIKELYGLLLIHDYRCIARKNVDQTLKNDDVVICIAVMEDNSSTFQQRNKMVMK